MTLIKVLDERLCNHCQPVARDQSGTVVDEHRCVLIKGHGGRTHTDGLAVWVDVTELMNEIERTQEPGKRRIISLPRKP